MNDNWQTIAHNKFSRTKPYKLPSLIKDTSETLDENNSAYPIINVHVH